MNYIEFDITIGSTDQSEQLTALLAEQNFDGFEETENTLKAFVAEDKFNQEDFDKVIHLFPSISYKKEIVENINWNAKWESDFEPVVVDNFAAIRASFHHPVKNVQHEIVITPKMSFGTGHHATTYLMIQQMAGIDLTNKTVLDFGTGTGVLAILAEKLGTASVVAIDNDEWSIENGKENIYANNAAKVHISLADSIDETGRFDIVLANINLNVILANLAAINAVTNKGSVIILSGFLYNDEAQMKEAIKNIGLTHLKTKQKGDWICMEVVKL